MQAKYLGVAELFSEQTWQKIGTKIKKCSSLKTVSGLCVQSLLEGAVLRGFLSGSQGSLGCRGLGESRKQGWSSPAHTSGKGPDTGLSAAPCCLRSAGATVMQCRLHGTRPGNAP